MLAASNVDTFLHAKGVAYANVWRGARSLPDYCVVKTLLLIDGDHHALAVIPQSRRIDLDALNQVYGRHFRLGGVGDAVRLFPGIPPQSLLPNGIGTRLEAFVDESLIGLEQVAFETNDPRRLVQIDGLDFCRLFERARCARISRHP